jgi:hypothetical protein
MMLIFEWSVINFDIVELYKAKNSKNKFWLATIVSKKRI